MRIMKDHIPISNTIDLIIEINKKYKIALNLYRHYDWPMKEKGYTYKKNCPRILNYDNWQGWRDFILLLKYRLEEGKMDEKRVRDLVRDELNRLSRSQDIPKWAEKAIDYVRDKKLMIGDIGENFNPNSLVSRAELAQTIYNLREQR